MLNWWALYGVLVSFWLIFHHHHKVIAPGSPEGVRVPVYLKVVQTVFFVGTLCLSLSNTSVTGFGAGYATWWQDYADEHSMLVWGLVVVPITIGLWTLKRVVFQVMAKPGHYDWWRADPKGQPCLHRLDMTTPCLLNLVFYGWLLLSPWLPFQRCFLRGFLPSLLTDIGG
jgi:hypothetical protein